MYTRRFYWNMFRAGALAILMVFSLFSNKLPSLAASLTPMADINGVVFCDSMKDSVISTETYLGMPVPASDISSGANNDQASGQVGFDGTNLLFRFRMAKSQEFNAVNGYNENMYYEIALSTTDNKQDATIIAVRDEYTGNHIELDVSCQAANLVLPIPVDQMNEYIKVTAVDSNNPQGEQFVDIKVSVAMLQQALSSVLYSTMPLHNLTLSMPLKFDMYTQGHSWNTTLGRSFSNLDRVADMYYDDNLGITVLAVERLQVMSIQSLMPNLAPTAQNLSLTTKTNTSVQGKILAADPEGQALTYQLATAPKYGNALINKTTGQVQYTPAKGFKGTDMFKVMVSDPCGNQVLAIVTVSVVAFKK